MAIYSDGLVFYQLWERVSYGSRIGGGFYTGRLSLERLEELLTSLDEAGVFRVDGTSAGGMSRFQPAGAPDGRDG